MRPNVSIIICTRNRADSLRETLESVGRARVPEDLPAELLVVDNGSTDHTRQVVEQAGLTNVPVRYVQEPRKGKGYAYNTGLAEARGDIFLFTDDDVRVPEDWIEGMCRPIASGEADAVAGGVRLAPELEREWMTDVHRGFLAEVSYDSREVRGLPYVVGANMAFARKVTHLVPEFDPELGPGSLGFGDEALFTLQLHKAGCRFVNAPEAVVEHHVSRDRLSRSAFLEGAAARGRVGAYLAYHWRHDRVTVPALRLAKHRLEYMIWRALHRRARKGSEAPCERELTLVSEVAFFAQYLAECGRPRAYPKFGLRRLARSVEAGSDGNG